MTPNCIERSESTVATQALFLMNNATIDQLAASFAERIEREAGLEIDRQIRWAYLVAFSRRPLGEELEAGRSALEQLGRHWADHLAAEAKAGRKNTGPSAPRRALASYCHALLNSAAFLYID
jgi:hypothetical protein